MRMRLAVIVTALIAPLGFVVGTAAPASADTPGCVTAREYRQVYQGMPQDRVHRIFDTRGTVLDRYDRWETDWDAYEADWDAWWYSEPYWDSYEWEYWLDSEPQVEDYESWVTDIVRSYKKCRGFDGGRGRVGVNFDNYSSASGMSLFKKVRYSPWSLVGIYW